MGPSSCHSRASSSFLSSLSILMARKTPPSQPEVSTWKPGLPSSFTLAPHCFGAGRGGAWRGRDLPKVTRQKHPVPRCPSTLRKGLFVLCPIRGWYISMPTAALLSSSLAEPRPGVTSISGLAVQGLGSECQNLKIKRQIVLIGCNYSLKRLVWREEKKNS